MVMAPSATTTEENYTPANFNGLSTTKIHFNHGDLNVENISDELVLDLLKKKISQVDTDSCEPGEEDAFYVADLGEVYRQHRRWKMNLRRVKPFYAVKCNPDLEVLRLLASLGTGFDCASKAEIERVLNLGVDPSRIIYAQPCKTKSYIRYARENGVKQMTFDNADELHKIDKIFPNAELFLRISTDDSASLCRLSEKFGANVSKAEDLLTLARDLGLNVVGVSFHVGSGAKNPEAFAKAVGDARRVFNQAETLGFEMKTLDVGGGFEHETFETFAAALTEALEDHFPSNVRVIGEPGRYYVANAFTLAANVIARRGGLIGHTGEQSYMLYLNDGVYGNFSNIIFDHQHPKAQILSARGQDSIPTEYRIFGPTCDGIDEISDRCVLPGLLDVGDWLYFENMGAYTKCSATRFNGFTDDHEVIYTSTEPGATALMRCSLGP